MKRISQQALASAQYCEETELTSCVCCGIRYAGGGTHCHQCQAPLEISRMVHQRNSRPQFISVLGASGAGKTVYLGMLLDILSRSSHGIKGTANGAFSVAVQEDTMTALGMRQFPEKTASEAEDWQWVHCEVTSDARPAEFVDIVTPDFAGEAIAHEVESPGTYQAIRSMIKNSGGLLILCDSLRARDEPLSEDLFAMKLASYIYALHEETGEAIRKQKLLVPIAVVFTKADVCQEAFVDPNRFAANHLPRLTQFCEHHLGTYRCFAASVVGSSVSLIDRFSCVSELPLHIEPHGIVDPLEWLVRDPMRRKSC